MNLIELIEEISTRGFDLKKKYINEEGLEIDWVCIFSQTDKEYESLIKEALLIGSLIEATESGLIYKFNLKVQTSAGVPKILKIRKPDVTKPEMGDVDFTTDYKDFKKKYLNSKNFTLIKREKFEMLELKDPEFNVRVYFSSIPPSRLRGVS